MDQEAGKKASINCQTAREVMNHDFIEVGSIIREINRRHNGGFFEPLSIEKLEEIPISREELKRYQGSFILLPGLPLSVMDFFSMALYDLGFILEDSWFVNMDFAEKERVDPCWYLFRKDIIPDSLGKTYDYWQGLLKGGEEIPRACELFYLIIFYNISVGTRLFRRNHTGCRDIIDGRYHPHVGFFSHGKELGIRYYRNCESKPWIGLAPIRKLFVS